MNSFSQHFNLQKTQAELDFVDVPIDGDIALFVDPFAISQRPDRWSQECHRHIIAFFDRVLRELRAGNVTEAREMFRFLREPNETRFGFSSGRPRGAGIGHYQSDQLVDALAASSAVKTGFLTSLEEAELMIEGIGRDKISDLTTNIIRSLLANYTREQCNLHNIPTQRVPLPPYYSPEREAWISDYFQLPVANGRPVLLVPKVIARYDPAYDHNRYYRRFVLEYLRAEHLDANSSLVHTFKSGRKTVYKKDLEASFPGTKENLYRFSREHPDVLGEYREHLRKIERSERASVVEPPDERWIADALSAALDSIPPGGDTANTYHNLMIGIVEFLFFPSLIMPRKEQEIHQGRKRIDIVMENAARSGIFARLHEVRKLPCAFVAIECKNYGREVGNPELDQLAGRFSPNRGKVGILTCRSFENRNLFIERCRDTLRDDRGHVIPLDDATVKEMLALIANNERYKIDQILTRLVDEVWLS